MSGDELRDTRNWKVKKSDGSKLEPATLEVLRHWVASEQIDPDDLVTNDEMGDWVRASEALELFDLFEKQGKKREIHPSPESIVLPESGNEIEMPSCAFHPERTSSHICVGCGKFICEECGERLEAKMYCRRCRAEKQVGAEPGTAVGAGPVARIIPGAAQPSFPGRMALASLVFGIVALLSAFFIIFPKFNITAALGSALVGLVAAMLGRIAISRIRLNKDSAKGHPFALAGSVSGAMVLLFSLAAMLVFTSRLDSAKRPGRMDGLEQISATRRQGAISSPGGTPAQFEMTEEMRAEREANAKQLLRDVERALAEGQLDQAVSVSRTILGLYPETETAKLIQERLPTLEQARETLEAQREELKLQNEQLARQRLDHALNMYAEGDHATALDLLRSVMESYPDTGAAVQARAEAAKIEKGITNQELRKSEEKASQLARQAEEQMESEQYDNAAALYRQIMDQYPQTPTASAVRSKLEEAELLAKDPSERAYRRLLARLDQTTYEEAISLIRDFMTQYPSSARLREAESLLQENQSSKSVADSLHNFGQSYFEEGRYALAAGRYQKLIDEYPRSRWIPKAKRDLETTLEKLRE